MIKPTRWLGRDRWGALNGELRGIGAAWTYGQNFWVLPYFHEPQTKWRYITTYHSRRKMKAVAAKLAVKTHTSTQEAVTETFPLLRIIYNADQENAEKIDAWLNLDLKEQEYLGG